MYNFKVGDIIKMDLKLIMKNNLTKNMAIWYSDESYTIIDTSRLLYDNLVSLDRKLQNIKDNIIWSGYLILDIPAMRRKKLERLGCTSLIITEV